MPLEQYNLPADSDDYEMIIIRRKRPNSPPPNPFFSIVLALLVSCFTVWLFVADSNEWQPSNPNAPTMQVPG